MRFVPAADRARRREGAIREAEMDRAAAAAGEKAVLAELRAIGLSLAASTGVLKPVQAREVRGLAKRMVGSTDLLGQVFRWEGEDYLVNDIAPGPTQSGGQALKAYACCVKRRVASAGPLSEHNSAFIPKGGLHEALYAGVPAPYWAPPAPFPLEPPIPLAPPRGPSRSRDAAPMARCASSVCCRATSDTSSRSQRPLRAAASLGLNANALSDSKIRSGR